MIEIENLTKRFGDLCAVNELNLTVKKGEFFAVLGPNAAGKTTTIKMIVGLMKPNSGSVRICGLDIQNAPLEARKHLAYVPDFPFLYEKLTAWEFIRFTGQLFCMPEPEIESKSRELIPIFNLEPYLKKTIDTLSHGTRQRIAIVSALLHAPDVIILDEPMVGLDPHHARVVKDVLKERTRRGMTVFLSTHQLSVAEEMADRIAIMNHGKIIALGTAEELRNHSGSGGQLEKTFLSLTAEEANLTENHKLAR
ncbi:MAG: Daunorubicin/doxorubicin resistance ATP-binding protein DrrA [Nitrospira sp.]|nr:Daunorubicin/doxorubicin resistance ATP-binding protein DrrA [Nitrospira sp.]